MGVVAVGVALNREIADRHDPAGRLLREVPHQVRPPVAVADDAYADGPARFAPLEAPEHVVRAGGGRHVSAPPARSLLRLPAAARFSRELRLSFTRTD